MSLVPITIFGDKILREKSKKVTKVDNELLKLIKNMYESMRNASGVGLAANQIGSDKSIFVVDLSPIEGYEKLKPLTFINPKIVYKSDETIYFEEGCLSIPTLRAEVERPEFIKIVYQDIDLKEKEIEADDFLARVIQHEYDHLRGILFTDRLDEEDKAKVKAELKLIKNRKVKVDYPITSK